ncbi:coadhesin-like [Oculina patagonica]
MASLPSLSVELDPNMPEIDLAFAISATSTNSNQTYALMQNTTKQLIDKYGVDKIHYSLIVYGDSVVRVVNFNTSFPISASDLKAAIDAQPPLSGGPVLTDALQEAFRVFNETDVRPNAKKVLVVMPDANSGAADNSLSAAMKPVEDIGVLVLSVGVGSAVDRNELSVISPNPKDVISASLNENPSVVARNIIDRILNRNIPEIEVGFAVRVSEIDSNAIFTVMQETRDTINHRYESSQVRYTVIIYDEGKRPTILNFGVNHQLSLNDLILVANNADPLPGLDFQAALTEAERLFRSFGRPTAKEVFIALTDTAKSDNDTELIIAGDALRRQGILVFSVNNNGNGVNAVTINQIDFLGVPTFTTDRSVVIAETIIKFSLEINIPLIDLTFAISATSLQNATTFLLMQTTINNIVSQYDIFRIHYSVIVFGSVATTHIDFGSNIPVKNDLIRRVARLPKSPGNPDLVQALQHAKRVYESQAVRPDARRFLVVIMDNASVNNRTDLNTAVTDLDNLDVVIIGVGIGNSVNPTDNEIITKDPRHIITVGINKSPDEIAKEILDAIFISRRTAGFSQWADWSACTKSCRSGGVAGTQRRTRVCVKSKLGCIGATAETRECNTQFCQGCEERGPFADDAYLSSPPTHVQAAAWARLNTSNPGANLRAWCVNPGDAVGESAYVQIDLGENVKIFRLATKGQERTGQQRWVTSYFISHSTDGLTFIFFQEDGQRKFFAGNTDSSSVVFNDVNITTTNRFIRFHPVSFNQQPCMQASVFGCTVASEYSSNSI